MILIVNLSVYRTFWSIFLTTGVVAVVIGGFLVICAAPLTNHKLYKVGGALHICGGKAIPPTLCILTCFFFFYLVTSLLCRTSVSSQSVCAAHGDNID